MWIPQLRDYCSLIEVPEPEEKEYQLIIVKRPNYKRGLKRNRIWHLRRTQSSDARYTYMALVQSLPSCRENSQMRRPCPVWRCESHTAKLSCRVSRRSSFSWTRASENPCSRLKWTHSGSKSHSWALGRDAGENESQSRICRTRCGHCTKDRLWHDVTTSLQVTDTTVMIRAAALAAAEHY